MKNIYKLGDICSFTKWGIGIKKAVPGEYPMVSLTEERSSHNEYQFDCEAVLIPLVSSTGHGHASMKRVHYQKGKFALGSILCAVIPKDSNFLSTKFLHIYLSYFKETLLVPLMRWAANVSLSISSLKNVNIIVPSIKRQFEIVEKEEVLSETKNMLDNENERQKFYLKKLHQQIFQDAVTGELTRNWRKSFDAIEPAGKLIEEINHNKDILIKNKTIKKDGAQQPIKKQEFKFNLPAGWEWCRLGEIFNFIDYRWKTPNKISSGVRLITAKNVKSWFLNKEPEEYISQKEYKERMTRGYPKYGDLLFTTEAPLWNICLLDIDEEDVTTGQRLITFQSYTDRIINKMIMFFMLSPYFIKELELNATGITALGIKASKLKNINLPLPPFDEQIVIVKKIEDLLKKMNDLEKSIYDCENNCEKLLQSVLFEAFQEQ